MNRGAGTRRQERRRYNPVSSNEGDVEPQQQGESLNPMEEGRLVPTNATTTTTTTTTTGMEVVSAGAAAGNSNNRRPRGRQQYSRISSSWEEPDDEEEQEEEERVMLQQDSNNNMNNTSEHSGIAGSTTSTTTITTMENNQVNNIDDDDDDDDDANKFTVTILDFAQKKFQITGVSPSWTVRQLKQAGAKIHKVVPARQRLIFRGKMLDDGDGDSNDNDDSKTTKTLKDYGITEDGTIVHLFPKPRVVITNSAANTRERDEEEQAAAADDDDEDDEDNDGARVPTIIMDAAEAERRSQILVLGSTDFIEAQNNVKLFSFMLLIISSIELLNLFGIAMGVPQDAAAENTHGFPVSEDDYNVPIVPEDDFFSPDSGSGSSGDDMSNHTGGFSEDNDPVTAYLSHWGPAQWADTLVSLVGVYVALLGLRASTSNTLRLARTYFTALIGVGIGWLLYNFFQTVELEHKFEEKKQEQREENNGSNNNLGPPLSESDIYNQAFQVMLLPALVWFMCWMRAWQFQQLLHEAEAEAEARIQTQLHLEEQEAELSLSSTTNNDDDDDNNNNNNNNRNTTSTTTTRHLPNHDEEMALNNSNAVLT